MKTLYRLFLVAIFAGFGFAQNANASHISGGNVTYECVGQDSFLVTLNLFRDCDGITVGSTQTMSFSSSCGSSFTATLTQQSSSEVSQLCPTQITNSTCNGGTLPGMEHYVYTAIVVMSPACNSWNMSWTSCCRNNLISNLNNPAGLDTYLFAEMYSATEDCNSSPTFTSLPIPYVCLNQVVNYNFGVVESDGDSVVYSLSNPYLTATTFPTYTGTYSFSQPLPGGNAVLNTQNGQLTFTPTATGVFVIAVMVTEYQSGTGLILGRSVRDVQVVVQGCSNSQPVIDSPGMYNFQGSGIQIDSNTIEVCIGNNFSFDVAFSDANISDSLFIFHNIYQALDSTAVVTITPGTSGAPTVVNVQWTAQPGSAAFNRKGPWLKGPWASMLLCY